MDFRLDYRRYRLPFRNAMRTAHGWWKEREGLIVRLEGTGGEVGFGEVAPIPWFGTETIAEAEEVLAGLGGAVDPGVVEAIDESFGCVRFALGAALGRDPGAPVATRRAVAALLPAGKAACEAADRALAAGYVAFKWKVGVLDDADEWVVLDDLLARLPAHAKLRLDANGAWTTRRAAKWLERCAERPIEFVEQPCLADVSGGAEVRRRTDDVLLGLAGDYPTPIALDESVAGLPSLRMWLERGWPGVVVVKPALAGDPAAVTALLAAHNADAVFSSALETSVGRQQALCVAFAFKRNFSVDVETACRFDRLNAPSMPRGWRPPLRGAEASPAEFGVTERQPRALGFGAGPIFQDGRYDGMPAVPFLEAGAGKCLNAEALWNVLN
jgi:O-succinylbenzoate synthase